jgi:hypothetical protein
VLRTPGWPLRCRGQAFLFGLSLSPEELALWGPWLFAEKGVGMLKTKKAKKPVSMPLRKYRKGMPWMFADAVPAWIQKHQLETYKKNYTLTECEEVWTNMRRISDAAKHSGDRDSIIVKHDPHTNRWASYETQEDVTILASKGKLKEGGYAERCRGIMPCARERMREILASRFDGLDTESVWNVCRNNGYIRFDSAKEGYNDTWRSWDVDPPAAVKSDSPFTGTKHGQYCYLVRGIDKSRHHYAEPHESSQFLQALDRRVTETGFELDTSNGEWSRFFALDKLRHRIHNVTKTEELRPLAAEKQMDGSWLIWDWNLGLVNAEESARIAKLPKWRYNEKQELYFIGKHEVDYDQEYDLKRMEPRTESEAIKYACDILGFEWNVQERLDVADRFPDCDADDADATEAGTYPFRKVNGLYHGCSYLTPEEKVEQEREQAEFRAELSHQRLKRMAEHEEWCKAYDAEIWDNLDGGYWITCDQLRTHNCMVDELATIRRLPLCVGNDEVAASFPQFSRLMGSSAGGQFLNLLVEHNQLARIKKPNPSGGSPVWAVHGIDLTFEKAKQVRDDVQNEIKYRNQMLKTAAVNEKAKE